VDDIAALIGEAGEPASVLGLSSGGALALEAAASGLRIDKVIAYEPPYVDVNGQGGGAAHELQLKRLLAAGSRGDAVKYFMKDMVGVPAAMVVMMRMMPWIWRARSRRRCLNAAVTTEFRIPQARLATINRSALV
jgi:pimeloyl-ACP methyl ester carboxylesterase